MLVHGEFERNDMVEYFGEQLDGFAHTENGWVQSYGTRYVKPPIIFGDVSRPAPMTVEWLTYAQSLTRRPVVSARSQALAHPRSFNGVFPGQGGRDGVRVSHEILLG